jgi:hypothetical protein
VNLAVLQFPDLTSKAVNFSILPQIGTTLQYNGAKWKVVEQLMLLTDATPTMAASYGAGVFVLAEAK